MSAKNEPAGPSLSSVIFAGVLCFVLGKMLAVASLVSQPVTVMSKVPEPESVVPGTAYYVKGSKVGGTDWRRKEEAMKAGMVNVISISESDLNRWSSSRLKTPKTPANEETGGWKDRIQLVVAPVNFKILDDQIQMATEVQIGDVFDQKTFTYVVTGSFESTKNGVRFVPESGFVGQAPLGMISPSRELIFSLVGKQLRGLEATEWLPDSFENLESINIVEGQLILSRRADG